MESHLIVLDSSTEETIDTAVEAFLGDCVVELEEIPKLPDLRVHRKPMKFNVLCPSCDSRLDSILCQ